MSTAPARLDRAALALIVALVVAAFGNVVFLGKSIVITDNANPLGDEFTGDSLQATFVPGGEWTRRNLVTDPNYRDPAMATHQTEPAAEFLRRSLLRRDVPFWDPYIGGGTPLFASFIPAFLFPPSLLVVLLGNGSVVRNAYILATIVAAGWLTYRLLRVHGLRPEAAIVGAIAFTFSGAIIQTAASGLGPPAALFSLPLLATAHLIATPSRGRAARLAIALAFVALASFPPILVQVFGLCALYAIVCVAARAEQRVPAAGWFLAAVAAGLALVSVVYVPSLLALRESPQVAQYYARAGEETIPPPLVMQLLSPTLMGGARVYADLPLGRINSDHLYYAGSVAILLAVVGLVTRAVPSGRPLKIAVAIAGGLALAKIFGLPPIQWIADLPLMRTIHYGAYFGIAAAYAICVLAAFGVDALGRDRAARRGVLAGALMLAAGLVQLRMYAAGQGVDLHPEGWRWIADFRLVAWFGLLTAVFAWFATWPRRAQAALWMLVGVLSAEGLTNAVYPRQIRRNVWDSPPEYIKTIAAAGSAGRVASLSIYSANGPGVFRQATLDSFTVQVSPRMFELYRRYFNGNVYTFLTGTRRLPPERVLDAGNVEFFVSLPGQYTALAEATKRSYRRVYEDARSVVLRRRTSPRYFFTSSYVVMTPEQALESLPQQPVGTIVLENAVSFPAMPGPIALPLTWRLENNDVEIVVDAPRHGLIFCSESQLPGWTATVDGRPTRILAADYAFRAVEVPAGRHVVRLRYVPPGLWAGSLLSIAGLLAVGIAIRRR